MRAMTVRQRARSATRAFFAFGKPWKSPYGRTRFLLCQAELVQLLQVEPEFGTGPEKVREPQRGVTGHRPLTVEDSSDPVGRYIELPAKLSGAHTEFPELLGKMLARVNCATFHAVSHQ